MGIIKDFRQAMGIVREARNNPLENPAVPLSSPALWQWLTGGEPTASGESITDVNALQITTVYRCVRYIAESIASLPLELWEHVNGGREKAVDHALFYLLATEPNPEMSAFTFKETWFGSCSLTGNGFAQIERNGIGQPVALWPLNPHKTKVVRKGNTLAYETSDGEPVGKKRTIVAEDMLHIRLFSLDGVVGLSPVGLMRQSLGLTKAAEKFGARFFGNGSRPGGVLINKGTKPDPRARQEIVESWNREHAGTNQGRTAFLFGGEWSYQQIGLSPEDSQFISTRNFQRADIAALWGLPPHYVGDTSRMSGNNAEQESLRVVTDTLRPYLSRGENEIIRKLMPTVGRKANAYFVAFDLSERLRGDFKTQMDGYAAGVQWGWFNPNDVRKKLGENPGPAELDVYRVPVNMQAAATLLDTESIQDQPLPGDDDAGAEGDENNPAPTPAERKMLGVYARTFAGMYRRAFRQLHRRSKKDWAALNATVGPVLRCVADLALEMNGAPEDRAQEIAEGLAMDSLKGTERRAAKWQTDLSPDQIDALGGSEFIKSVRAIHINASRELSAARAAAEVEVEAD